MRPRVNAAVVVLATLIFWASVDAVRAADVAPANPETAPPRLSHDVVPTFEAVDLTLDPEQAAYRGRVTIDLTVVEPTRELRFHARSLTIDSLTLRGPSGPVPAGTLQSLPPDQERVRFSVPLEPGAYRLEIGFHNDFNTRAISLFRVVTGSRGYLFTQFEDTEAREAFPCWDEPEFKIPWTMMLTVPAGDLAVGNTPIVRETPAAGMKRVEFARTRPLPSYLVAIAVGPFETVPIPGMSVPGRVVTVQGAGELASEAARVTPAIVRSLEDYFGRPFPYEKLDLIAAPEFLYGAMENAGAVVFADRLLLLDPSSMDPGQRDRMTSVIAHELAHQWFGDLVTMKWWDDLWLNESFASWMGTKVMEDVIPEAHSGIVALNAVERAFTIDSRPSTSAMRQKITGSTTLGQTANELTYNKGQAVLTMFEGWLGRDAFRSGVLRYLADHEWSNAEGKDLWRALGGVSGDDIDAAMASFLDQPGVPLVSVEPLGGGRVRLEQSRFLTFDGPSSGPELWRIPVILRYPAPTGVRTLRVWLTRRDTVADLGVSATPAWIEPNAEASGYYRWRLPDALLDPLVAARMELTARERIDLIAGLTAQLRAGLIHGDRYLSLMSRLADDPSPEVIRALVEALNTTRTSLVTPRSAPAYAEFLRATLSPSLERFGMEPSSAEPLGVTLARPALLRLMADAGGDERVIAYAESLGLAYRRDRASVPPSLIQAAIVLGALHGDRAEFEDYRQRFETTKLPAERQLYLEGLGSFRDPELRRAALQYALDGPLRPQEPLVIPRAMALDGAGNVRGDAVYPDEVVQWMMDHFAQLSAKMPPNFSTRIMALGAGCSKERLGALRAYFADPAHQAPGATFRLERLGDAIGECAQLHDREAERVERWLEAPKPHP